MAAEGSDRPANDLPDGEKSFLADMTGLFAQHAAMWSVYTESIKILVSVTSLPVLAAALIISASKDTSIEFDKLPDLLIYTLFALPFLDFFLLGVVIHNRLVILFYARALNGYRRIYLNSWNARRPDAFKLTLPMPIDNATPSNHELTGPMGLIVHCSGFVNGLFMFGALSTNYTKASAGVAGIAVLVAFETWYGINCKIAGPRNHGGQASAAIDRNALPIALEAERSAMRREAVSELMAAGEALAAAREATEALSAATAEKLVAARKEADAKVVKASQDAAAKIEEVQASKLALETAASEQLKTRDDKIAELSQQLAALQAELDKLRAP